MLLADEKQKSKGRMSFEKSQHVFVSPCGMHSKLKKHLTSKKLALHRKYALDSVRTYKDFSAKL